ncbi:MOSC domain-containing protein [Halorubrum vacuolatum]|uniref:MOSC domain-containing protein n=1 Tax=Halorubrum vacuolatum TaxID=63740 RepID=A0A238WYY0_HALVU|nr:MOSC domain-containing protein [Halorubrum vacuolatum]SNR51571.1 MOSC domain-containing protein [Halorubrum vacuolatum]
MMEGADSPVDSASGTVTSLVTAPTAGADPVRKDRVAIVAGGVAGDRYCVDEDVGGEGGHFALDACAVTLVAAEALAAVQDATGIDVSDGRHRRNIVVRGFGEGMDALLDATVAIGDARVRPTRRRPPCAHVEQLAGEEGLASALSGRGGLCCTVLEPGAVGVGDPVRIVEPDPGTAGEAIAARLREAADDDT